MTPSTIRAKIARCIEIQRLVGVLEAEEKEIKALLIAQASVDKELQTATEGGGWSWEHRDSDGNLGRVTQPAPTLKAKLDPESTSFAKVREAAGRCFMELFIQVPAYKPVEDFRSKADSFLGTPGARKLLKLVTTESRPRVEFEVKEAA
jgi:hypothetical protein